MRQAMAIADEYTESSIRIYASLMADSLGLPNDDLFARMLASQALGTGVLPDGLGLSAEDYAYLLARHFPGCGPVVPLRVVAVDRADMPEWQDLIGLLLDHRAGRDLSELWLAQIVVAACMGGDHLWQDLGLWSRADLSRLMTENFPALAAKNDRDMKWKKFLYRQICEREGIHVCPAPSCQACADYAKCFGPET